jgi:hypothetical protein
MRNLTQEEIEEALDDNGEPEEGCVAIEATVQELADLNVGTGCGKVGNQAFKVLADKGYGHRKCRGWFEENRDSLSSTKFFGGCVCGMFHIKIQTDKTAEKVERIVGAAGGSLRYSGDSLWEGFKEFEIE